MEGKVKDESIRNMTSTSNAGSSEWNRMPPTEDGPMADTNVMMTPLPFDGPNNTTHDISSNEPKKSPQTVSKEEADCSEGETVGKKDAETVLQKKAMPTNLPMTRGDNERTKYDTATNSCWKEKEPQEPVESFMVG